MAVGICGDEMRAGRQSFHRLDDASISERANSKKSQEQRRIRRDWKWANGGESEIDVQRISNELMNVAED